MKKFTNVILLSLSLYCCFLPSVKAQIGGCGLEIISTELVIISDYEVQIIVEVFSSGIQGDGIAYPFNNIDLESLGDDIFWTPATFSIQPNSGIFQIIISGTSPSIISMPDELELSGRIAFSFVDNTPDDGIKIIDEELLVDTDDLSLNNETTVEVVDTLTHYIDTNVVLIDTVEIFADSIGVKIDSLTTADDNEIEPSDSINYANTIVTENGILIGNEVILANLIPNLCDVAYVIDLPISGEVEEILNGIRLANNQPINKAEIELLDISFDALFDDETVSLKTLSIQVFPNPTADYFYIHPNKTIENAQIEIYTTNGRIVLQKELTNNNYAKINIHNLPNGLYFVALKNNTEISQLTKLFIK